MQKHPNRLWIAVFLLGFAFDFLFWKKAPGMNFAIFVALCLGLGLWLLWQGGARPAWKSLLLLAPIGFLAVMSFIRLEPMTTLLNYALTLAFLALLVMTFIGGRWLSYSLSDYVAKFFRLIGGALGGGVSYSIETRRANEGKPRSGGRRIWAVLRGLLLALPIVAVFAALLSSADVIFADRLEKFIELFRLERLPEYLFRGVYIAALGYLLAGILLHAAGSSGDEKLIGEEKPLVGPFLGFTEAAIVLGSLAALFAAFVTVQFQYFFGGQVNISLEGFTYAEYARRGFGELVMVAFFSLLLLLSLSGVTRRESRGQRAAFSALGGGLVALVLVMLVSAFQRLLLYESAYGFTRLRAYTHVFMIWLGLLLVAVIALEALRRQRAFAIAAVLAALGFAVTLNLLNVDAFIVSRNVARLVQGNGAISPDAAARGSDQFDSGYLATLSADAYPALARAYADPALPADAHEALGAALVCWRARNFDYGLSTERRWEWFHLARWQADQAWQRLRSDLSGYRIETGYPYETIAPSGKVYSCSGYLYD